MVVVYRGRISRRDVGAGQDGSVPNSQVVIWVVRASTLEVLMNTTQLTLIQIVGVFLAGVGLGVLYFLLRKPKGHRSKPNESSNTWFGRWRSGSNRGQYSSQLQPSNSNLGASTDDDRVSRERSADQPEDVEMEIAGQDSSSRQNNDAGVDRQTSVRSIMTLPPYSVAARPTEQVLGREGERAGIDVVLEHPESVDEEEGRRDEEMESLYQIRRARRQENAEREDRRRQRREARARGDLDTLIRLQEESRRRVAAQADGTTLSAQLIAEHQTKNRDRRVSSVQYADIGVARHDGSRVRAASFDSDRQLLSSAASIATGGRPDSLVQVPSHQRGRSASSVRSISSIGSDDQPRIAGDFEVISLDRSRSPSIAPSIQIPGQAPQGELSTYTTPLEQPPNYEHHGWGEAPPYESPVARTAPQLPMPTSIPAIEITGAVSPNTAAAPTRRTSEPHDR
jgi:hypothetical protein